MVFIGYHRDVVTLKKHLHHGKRILILNISYSERTITDNKMSLIHFVQILFHFAGRLCEVDFVMIMDSMAWSLHDRDSLLENPCKVKQ